MYEYRVLRIIRVVDGDTCDVECDLGFGLHAAFRFRVADVDAPETRGANATEAGTQAKLFTESWLGLREGHLRVRTRKSAQATVGIGDGAFGRWLAEFLDDAGESLGVALGAAGFDEEHPPA